MKMYIGEEYVRINKKTAKKLYDSGEIIYLCACKLRPGGFWRPEIAIAKDGRPDGDVQYFSASDSDFDKIIDEFTYYNCDNGSGYYPSYYIKK